MNKTPTKVSPRQRALKFSEVWLYNSTIDSGAWMMVDKMMYPRRRFHSSITFRNGPVSGTVWVCGGEVYSYDKKELIYKWTYSTSCECYNDYHR